MTTRDEYGVAISSWKVLAWGIALPYDSSACYGVYTDGVGRLVHEYLRFDTINHNKNRR